MVTPAAWERWLRSWLVVTLLVATLSWSLHFVSFNHVKEGALWLGCLGLATPFVLRPGHPLVGFRVWWPTWCGVWALGILSVVRAEVPWLAVASLLRTSALLAVATFACSVGRTEAGRRMLFRTIVGTATVAAALALGQRAGMLEALFPSFSHYDQTMYSVFGNAGLLAGYLALGLVLLPELLKSCPRRGGRWLLAAAAGGTMAVAFLYSASRGAHVALLVGLAVYLVAHRPPWRPSLPKGAAGVLLFGLLCVVAGAPSLSKWAMTFQPGDVGVAVRGWIWHASVAMFWEQPFLGVGMGNFSYGLPPYLGLPSEAVPDRVTVYHAHLDLLELLCEVGGLGILLLSGQLYRLRRVSSGAAAGTMTLVVFSCFHPMWASAPHALAFLLLLGMNMAPGPVPLPVTRVPVRATRVLMAGILLGGAVLHGVTTLGPSFLLRRAEDRHLAGIPAEEAYRSAIAGPGYRGEAHESFGIYRLTQGDGQGAWQSFQAARRELNTGRLHLLMGMTAQQLGWEEVATRCFVQAQQRGVTLNNGGRDGRAQ